jgi:hypothetical protein
MPEYVEQGQLAHAEKGKRRLSSKGQLRSEVKRSRVAPSAPPLAACAMPYKERSQSLTSRQLPQPSRQLPAGRGWWIATGLKLIGIGMTNWLQ